MGVVDGSQSQMQTRHVWRQEATGGEEDEYIQMERERRQQELGALWDVC